MIVYYIEADSGHLMNEVLKENHHRTALRGHAFSFIMPWEDIVKSLHQRIKSIPRDPECLKYTLRLHLKVAGQDSHQHLKQVHLRPAILVLLLQELFSRKHEAFSHSPAAQAMRLDMDPGRSESSAPARTLQELERAVYQNTLRPRATCP